jgi:hypothetical protein
MPWSTVTIVSPRKPLEIMANVECLLAAKHGRWHGTTDVTGFSVYHRPRWTSACAIGVGSIQPVPNGTRVLVTIRMPILAMIVLVASILICLLATTICVREERPDLLWLWVIPTWGGTISMTMFRLEKRHVEQTIRGIAL